MNFASVYKGQMGPCVSQRVKNCFSAFMALYPILCIYKAFYRFTIGDIILMLFFLISLKYPLKSDRRVSSVVLFSIYAIIMLCLNLLFSQLTATTYVASTLFFRIAKFIFYMLCVFMCGKQFFDTKVFQKAIFIISIISCFFIAYQYIMYYGAGKIVLGRIPGLTLYLDEYSKIDYNLIYSYSFRPSSFFLEPALFCHYTIVSLILVLFIDKMPTGFNRVFIAILVTAGILMSTAGQGVLYLVIVYTIYGFKGIKSKAVALCFIICAIAIALVCYNKIEVVQYAVDRLLFNENAFEARLGSYKYVFKLNGLHSIFGYGYGTTPNGEYLPGAAYVWYGCGIIGLFLSFRVFGSFYHQTKSITAKIICIMFFVMFFGTGLFYNYMLYWYFTLILCTANLKGDFDDEHSLHSGSIQTKHVRQRHLLRQCHSAVSE